MIKLKFKDSYSILNEDSEVTKLILNLFSTEKISTFEKAYIKKKDAKKILNELNKKIVEKVNIEMQNDLKEIKEIRFGENKVKLNLRNSYHKEAFFLIKAYNLIYSFLNEKNKLIVEKINEDDLIYKSSSIGNGTD